MRRILFILFFISGALSLVYEVVWLRLLILVFGSTHFAVTSVLTAFMAGLALGSLLLGRYSDRSGKHPLAIYGLLEIGIGLFAVLTPVLLGSLKPLAALIGSGSGGSYYAASAVRFLCVMVILILPTAMMGGTLPVLSRLAARNTGEIGWSVGALYGANTLGAVAGTALTGFVLMPQAGARATLILAALGNVLIGLIALEVVRRWWLAGEPVPGPLKRSPLAASAAGQAPAVLLLLIAGSGFIALLYEVAWTRVLSLVLGSSVYAFTSMLATFLAGLALGAGIGARIADRLSRRRASELLAGALAAAALAGYATFRQLPDLPVAFANAFHGLGLASPEAGTSWAWALRLIGIEFLIAFAVMLPATIFMGMVFPLVVRLWAGSTEALGTSVGKVYAANTGGTILGAALSGFVILPALGLRGGLLFAVAGGLALAAGSVWIIPGWTGTWKGLAAASAVAGAAILALSSPAWDPFVINSGIFQYVDELEPSELTAEGFSEAFHRNQELLYYEEGLISTVVVSREGSTGNVWISVNGKVDASSQTDLATQLLLGHLPMLHLPDRDAGDPGPSVLVIGYASGITTGAVTRHDPARVTAVEIEPAVLRGSVHFDAFNHRPLEDSRVTVVEDDGRSLLLVSDELYDVIISEPSNPWMTVAANLFTRDFFEIGKRRLSPGGIFSQWVPVYGLPPRLLKAIVRTFVSVFPHVRVYAPAEFGDIILLGSGQPLPVRLDTMGRRLEGAQVKEDLERIRLRSVQDLLTYHLMGEAEARAFAGEGPLNTDDNAMIEFAAPLTLHVGTRRENQVDLRSHVDDPLAGARGLPAPPEERAALYASLGEAFYLRGMTRRAFGALSRAQEIHPTPEQAARLAIYRSQVPGESGR